MTEAEVIQLMISICTLGVAGITAYATIKTRTVVNEVQKTTNGLAQRNESIAKSLGIAEGTAAGLEKGRNENIK